MSLQNRLKALVRILCLILKAAFFIVIRNETPEYMIEALRVQSRCCAYIYKWKSLFKLD